MSNKADRVVWLDRGWQCVFIGFCPSEKAWKREMKLMACPQEPYPASAGCASRFVYDGKTLVIVTLGPAADAEERSRVEIAGLLCHEATHVWQAVRKDMGEKEPSIEFEAYSMQAIFQGLYQAWLDTRAPDAMKAADAQTVKA